MLYAENVYVRFGGLTAVDNVSLHIAPGEIHAIIGPNGAGKSTFFNAVSGINRASEGTIRFLGKDITSMNQHQVARQGIGRTFQNIKLFKSMTVAENVLCGFHMNVKSGLFADMFGTASQKREEEKLREECLALLKRVDLYDKRDVRCTSLPYGDQRKLEIVRAMATSPKLLMLDEPAAGMNPTETEELKQFIKKINSEGLTILLIEHDVKMVMSLADTITVLNHGAKIAEGSAEEVRSNDAVIEAYLGKSYRKTQG
ncbi:MAG: ABC transporter ATP-binding protein [Lachnospiraceae bacterium]|nr:ABC transporter ATP-binding protein [Lachnospiraceae bacterium]